MTWNGSQSWGQPSPTDIMLDHIRRDLWTMREDLGGLKAGQRLTLDAVKQGFYKIDKAHERITRVQEQVLQLEQSIAARSLPMATGQPPTAPPGLLASLTAFTKALTAGVPPLKDLLIAATMLAAALGLIFQAPTPGSSPSADVPPASAIPSASPS